MYRADFVGLFHRVTDDPDVRRAHPVYGFDVRKTIKARHLCAVLL